MIDVLMTLINPTPQAPPGAAEKINLVLGYLMWAGGVVCFVSIATLGMIFMLNATGRANGAKDVVVPAGWVALGSGIMAAASTIGYSLTGV